MNRTDQSIQFPYSYAICMNAQLKNSLLNFLTCTIRIKYVAWKKAIVSFGYCCLEGGSKTQPSNFPNTTSSCTTNMLNKNTSYIMVSVSVAVCLCQPFNWKPLRPILGAIVYSIHIFNVYINLACHMEY